jgi:hypothetical protein
VKKKEIDGEEWRFIEIAGDWERCWILRYLKEEWRLIEFN